ncbi:MAG TPA: hypothetical protein VFB79_11365 [Candidatus Angelobacter sp.]|nr:hypothetical protein [Candidatus Angelobacter sp.]
MRALWGAGLAFVLFVATLPLFAVDGTFRGRVIDPPENIPVTPGWIFVQGRNRALRRVNVSKADIVFGEDIPASQRRKCDSECLSPGLEVRITARQDSNGEWLARRVEILHLTKATQVADLKVDSALLY